MTRLNPYFARNALERVQPQLPANFERLTQDLLNLLDSDGKTRVSDVHERLFPANTTASANAALSRMINRVNRAADEANVPVRLAITAAKKGGPRNRWIWFEGDTAPAVHPHTSELNAIPEDRLVHDQRALSLEAEPVVVLITANENETKAVMEHFDPDCQRKNETRGKITYSDLGLHSGMRVKLRVSEQGQTKSQNAAQDAQTAWNPDAIIAVGIAFGINLQKQKIGDVLISRSVRDYELGRVNANDTITPRGPNSPAPECLYQRFLHLDQDQKADPSSSAHWPMIHFGTILSGNKLVDNLDYRDSLIALESKAIGGEMEAVGLLTVANRHKVDWLIVKGIGDWGDGGKNAECKDHNQLSAARNAARVVKAALDAGNLYMPSPGTDTPSGPGGSGTAHAGGNRAAQPPGQPNTAAPDYRLPDLETIRHWVSDPQGIRTGLNKNYVEELRPHNAPGVEVLPDLQEWINQNDAPPLFALLGSYGMGKTITCQRLAQALQKQCVADPTRPVPLYFDLRHVTGLDKRVPTLRQTLEECMERGWLGGGHQSQFTLEDVFMWIDRGAVVIIDGLDEVLVKLTAGDGHIFMNTLLTLPAEAESRAKDAASRRFKLVIACRTQYFRTLRDQKNLFTSREHGEYGHESYRALVLLPFSETQVLSYLAQAVPDTPVEKLLELVRSVHNLQELTARPYTLSLVAEFIPEIESEHLAGRPVYGVTLYRRMTQRWLERDGGKHHIQPEHKMRLAAHLAAYLWRSRKQKLPAEELEPWFHEWLESEPDLHRRYRDLQPDQLEEDLRTATFLARDDTDGQGAFRFAHTSLLEFFLADYLFRAVRSNQPQAWAMSLPSRETLDFLGQMLKETDDQDSLHTLGSWRHQYRAQTSEMLFAYALHAQTHGWPVPILHGLQLTGAALRGWQINGPQGSGDSVERLDLGPADFSSADLREARFQKVRMQKANFHEARLDRTVFLGCQLQEGCFYAAQLTATTFRHCKLEAANWEAAELYRSRFLWCEPARLLSGETPKRCIHALPTLYTPEPGVGDAPPVPRKYYLSTQWGHSKFVTSCAFDPEGRRLASAGGDGTVRLWDAESGEALRTLTGHKGTVCSCVFDPEGRRLASAGDDGTVRLWDADSGEALRTLTGHKGTVCSCAFDSDGRRLASAGGDGTVRLWDAASGEALRILTGHESWVLSCVFDPEGRRLASAGLDGTVRLWDADSGEALRTLTDHEGEVRSCVFDPEGRRLASAGDDGTVRLWDAESGEALRILTGHESWVLSCVFDPEGRRLASAGLDCSVRLWDAESGEALRTLTDHEGVVFSCAFDPEGRRLASAGGDGTVRLWDATSGEALRTLTGHKGPVSSCVFDPEGRRLASAGDDGTMRLWDAESGTCLRIHASCDHTSHAVWQPTDNQIVEVTGNAWEWLAWRTRDDEGQPTCLPLETFGPTPTARRLAQPTDGGGTT